MSEYQANTSIFYHNEANLAALFEEKNDFLSQIRVGTGFAIPRSVRDDVLADFVLAKRRPTSPIDLYSSLSKWRMSWDAYNAKKSVEGSMEQLRNPYVDLGDHWDTIDALFGSMDGAVKLMDLNRHTEGAFTVNIQQNRTSPSLTRAIVKIPWSGDTPSSLRRGNEEAIGGVLPGGWDEEGYAPAFYLDFDLNPEKGELYVYEIGRHKFGWSAGISARIILPSYFGDYARVASLKESSPLSFGLYQQVGRTLQQKHGIRRDHHLYPFAIGMAIKTAEKALGGDKINTIFMVSPSQSLERRNEAYIARDIGPELLDRKFNEFVQSMGAEKSDDWYTLPRTSF